MYKNDLLVNLKTEFFADVTFLHIILVNLQYVLVQFQERSGGQTDFPMGL